ncbi:hypothetical protein NEIRO03_1271 [Nematocida sp. AWRm78]|nr:hypothetical protein NEIRO02_1366 [Nematocida sp. AWRm79]KAI5183692.1 hypothetical protein NEIRO03_1271 [Nematocida sp. AWRm78]
MYKLILFLYSSQNQNNMQENNPKNNESNDIKPHDYNNSDQTDYYIYPSQLDMEGNSNAENESILKFENINTDFICLYNCIKVLVINALIPLEVRKQSYKNQDSNSGSFVINDNDNNEQIEKKWLTLGIHMNHYIEYILGMIFIFVCAILMGILCLISLKTCHIIEKESVHALRNLIPINTYPLLHKYVLSGNFIYTLLMILPVSYITKILIETAYWIYKKSESINIANIIDVTLIFSIITVSIYFGYSFIMWKVSSKLTYVENSSIQSNVLLYGWLLIGLLYITYNIYTIYKKKRMFRHVSEYIAGILYTILLIMSITAIIYTFTNNGNLIEVL